MFCHTIATKYKQNTNNIKKHRITHTSTYRYDFTDDVHEEVHHKNADNDIVILTENKTLYNDRLYN